MHLIGVLKRLIGLIDETAWIRLEVDVMSAAFEVQLDKSFTEDLDIDSISMMTIVVNAEEKFGVRIPDEEVKNLKTVEDAVNFIDNAQA